MNVALGIRSQLILGIVLITLAGIGLIGILSIKIVENSALYWKISEAGRIVRIIRVAANKPQPDDAMINYIGEALREADIDDYRLNGRKGNLLIQSGTLPADGEVINASNEFIVKRVGGGWFKGPGDLLYISAPLDKASGRIEFTLTLREIKEDMAGVRRFLLLYAFLDSAVIIVFGVFFLSRSIVAPIKQLDEAATRIAGGKLYERAFVSVDNEIGSLASSFNTMAERLEAEIKALERVNLELLTTQEELLRSSTLAAVGRLAAGIAHEIGNPLGALHGYLDILDKGLPDKEDEKEIIARALKEASRIDTIVREFLEISRPSKRASEPVDVNRLLDETVSTISVHKDFESIRTEFSFEQGLPSVIMDEGKLRQVFMNILINAAHSMNGKDENRLVRIETSLERRTLGARPRRRRDDSPLVETEAAGKDYVVIRFIDNGSGISSEDAKKIFDPFFSTKDVGKGTGLGLFISQSIINAYGGEINFETRSSEGSTFMVVLPSGSET